MVAEALFGSLRIGPDVPVRLMGAINVSPESFYKGSVYIEQKKIVAAAVRMQKEGADILDVGAMSTAPYLRTEISVDKEIDRLVRAIRAVKENVNILISADTMRASVAEAAFKAGADVLNDVSGLKGDPKMPLLAQEYEVGLLLMAREKGPSDGNPIRRLKHFLSESLEIAARHGIEPRRIVIDPGIGFFRESPWPWYVWDSYVLKNLGELKSLERPLAVAVSRKSFIGEILHQPKTEDRLTGSLAATAIAVLNGAAMIRTHEVGITSEAVRIAEQIRNSEAVVNS